MLRYSARSQRRQRQLIEVDKSCSLWDGLEVLVTPILKNRINFVTRELLVPSAYHKIEANEAGLEWTLGGTASERIATDYTPPNGSPHNKTLFGIFKTNTISNNTSNLINYGGAAPKGWILRMVGNGSGCSVALAHNSSQGFTSSTVPNKPTGSYIAVVCIVDKDNGSKIYCDGELRGTLATFTENTSPPSGAVYLLNGANGSSVLAGVASRQWTDAEAIGFCDNPWQFFKQRTRYVPQAASGGPTLKTASDAFSLTVTDSQSSFLASLLADGLSKSISDASSLAAVISLIDDLTISFGTTEDFLTYTQDINGSASNFVAVDQNSIVYALVNTWDSSIYKDYGIDYFSGFTHRVEMCCTRVASTGYGLTNWMISNSLADYQSQKTSKTPFYSLKWHRVGTYLVTLRLEVSSSVSPYFTIDASVNLNIGQTYFVEVELDPDTGANGMIMARIYSDHAFSILVDTLSVTLPEVEAFRYLFSVKTEGLATAYSTGYVRHLSLDRAAGYTHIDSVTSSSDTMSIALNNLANAAASVISSDTITGSLSDTVQTLINAVAVADTITASITASQNSYLESARNDALNAALNAVLTIFSEFTRADGLGFSIADAAAIAGTLAASDSLSASVSEGLSVVTVSLMLADALGVTVSDAAQVVLSTLARSDTATLSLADVPVILSTLARSDSAALSVADAAALGSTIDTFDALSMSVVDSVAAMSVTLQLADALDVAVADSAAVVLALLERADDVLAAIADVSLLNSFSNSVDNLNLTVTDAAQIAALINALDSVALGITDAAIRQAFGTIIARLSAKLSIYPSLAGKLKTYVSLSGKTKVNNEE